MTLEQMEKRLRALEDLEEIKKLHRRYISYLDNLRFDKALDLFAEDAIVEVRDSGPRKGKKEIAEIYLGVLAKRTTRKDGHLVGQPDITVEGDTAKGHWIVYILFSEPSVQWVQGRNDCEYVKEDGHWKFSKLKFTRTLASQPSLFP
jgi:ketosteroid isomerase-like protein